MSNLPRITVITPNLNRGRFLERTICSVLDQGYGDLEYMVMDGGSADDSVPIIRRYDSDLAYWRSEADDGPAVAIDHGLERATGQIIGILNSTDLYLPGALDEVVTRMLGSDAPRWVVGDCHRISPDDNTLGYLAASLPTDLAAFLMHDSGVLPAPSVFFHRSVFEEFGPFDRGMRFTYGFEYACRLLAAGLRPTTVSGVLAASRDNRGCLSAPNILDRGREHLRAVRRYADYVPVTQRYVLWKNCDERRRIYALAEAEALNGIARGFLWRRLLRRPWWVTSDSYRRALVRSVVHTQSPAPIRRAA